MKVPNLLKNQVSLWIVSIIAAAMIINYLVKSQFTSLIVLLAVGFLSTMFTKNMVITLLVAVGITLLFRQFGGVREGMKEGAEHEDKKDEKDDEEEEEEKEKEDEEEKESRHGTSRHVMALEGGGHSDPGKESRKIIKKKK